jgi:hypothetical protein
MDESAIERGIYNRNTLLAVLVVFCAATMGVAFAYFPEGTQPWRMVMFGLTAGPLFFLSVFVNHMIAPTADGY